MHAVFKIQNFLKRHKNASEKWEDKNVHTLPIQPASFHSD